MAQRITLPDCARRTLAYLYPLDDLFPLPAGRASHWERVDFYQGLPWWSMGAVAITIPDVRTSDRFSIFLGKRVDFCNPKDLSVLVHEFYHIYQYISDQNGVGSGSFRPGFIAYFQKWVQNGYRKSPFEEDAHAFDQRFMKALPVARDAVPVSTCLCRAEGAAAEVNSQALAAVQKARDLPLRAPYKTTPDPAWTRIVAYAIAGGMWVLELPGVAARR